MKTTEKTIEVLNDLILLNNDRIAGFEKAMSDIDDQNADLKMIFQEYTEQSRKNSQELTQLVAGNREDAETGTSMAGGLHRVWIDVKSLFGGSDRKSILSEAERGEDAIVKAYRTALKDGDLLMDSQVMDIVSQQSQGIDRAHDRIKMLRDAA